MRTRVSSGRQNPLMRKVRARHPGFFEALIADARIAARCRGERSEFRSTADTLVQACRLMWVADAFFAQTLSRAKARLQALGVPMVPRLAHRAAMKRAQLSIGDGVIVHPGIYLPHGQVVIDGLVEVHSGTKIRPWVTIGLKEGNIVGATVGRNVRIGTGAKLIGPVAIGAGAKIGANAVVLDDVPPNSVVVGVPARVVRGGPGKVQSTSGS